MSDLKGVPTILDTEYKLPRSKVEAMRTAALTKMGALRPPITITVTAGASTARVKP
jgi:hypothetical protein